MKNPIIFLFYLSVIIAFSCTEKVTNTEILSEDLAYSNSFELDSDIIGWGGAEIITFVNEAPRDVVKGL